MAESKKSEKDTSPDVERGELTGVVTPVEFKNEVEQHETDMSVNVDRALEQAKTEKEEEARRSVDDAARMATSQPDLRREGHVEAVLVDAARKAEDTKLTDEARAAAVLGDGTFRVRPDVLERVPVQEDTGEARRRFDVGGQPVFDQELAQKSKANLAEERAKAEKAK